MGPSHSRSSRVEAVPTSPRTRGCKFRRTALWLILAAAAAGLFGLMVYGWPRPVPRVRTIPAAAGMAHVWLTRATTVDLSHLGLHTHRNVILFDLRGLHIPRGVPLRVVVHCQYETARPFFEPIESYLTKYDNASVVVVVPTRFADLVALVSPIVGSVYLRPDSYYCEVAWQK